MASERTIASASFDEKVVRYMVVNAAFVCAITIIGIPLLVVVVPLAFVLARVYFSRLRCELTDRNLQIDKGVLTRTESTIPLDKITDMQMIQGPLMRWVGIHGLKVETAGQGGATGGLGNTILGVVDARAFRDRVLAERDRVTDIGGPRGGEDSPAGSETTLDVLREIRDAVARIEAQQAS